MVEFFQSIYRWLAEHKDQIIAFLTSTNFAGIVSMIVITIKQTKATKIGTLSMNNLIAPLKEVNALATRVGDAADTSNTILSNIATLQNKITDITNNITKTLDIVQYKVNSMLEVQSLVYGTIKDDNIRANVINILTTAKLSEDATRAELEKQIEELKKIIAENTAKQLEEEAQKKAEQERLEAEANDKTGTKKSTASRY